MNVSVDYLTQLDFFSNMKLIAGESGLSNTISSCGILDYEYDKRVSLKYNSINFRENQLIVTSFLYAKDNDTLLLDAIKSLISRKCSCLIIKNVFKINISPVIIRYANQNNFPIFLLKDQNMYFEDIIIKTHELITTTKNHYYFERQTDILLNNNFTSDELIVNIRTINPSFKSDSVIFHFRSQQSFNIDDYAYVYHKLNEYLPYTTYDSLIYYDNGFLFIHTKELLLDYDIDHILTTLTLLDQKFDIGISELHHHIACIKEAIQQSIYTSALQSFFIDSDKPVPYEEIGLFQLIRPLVPYPCFEKIIMQYIMPLKEYDDENKTNLLNTIIVYIQFKGDLMASATYLSAHYNTIRYRIEKASSIINGNIFKVDIYEKVAMAIRIYTVKNIIENKNTKIF